MSPTLGAALLTPGDGLFSSAETMRDIRTAYEEAFAETRRVLRALPASVQRDRLVVEAAAHVHALSTRPIGLARSEAAGLRERAQKLAASARAAFSALVEIPVQIVVEERCGCEARFLGSEEVDEILPPTWERWRGPVYWLALDGHPTATSCYAWVGAPAPRGRLRVVLAGHEITSARLAVLADAAAR